MAHMPLLKALLWSLLVFVQIHEHRGCLEEERIGLLELKAFLKSNIHHADGRLLPSWINNAKSECCRWERVTCSSTTTHVIKLSLDNIKQDPYYKDNVYDDEYRWLLNVSLLLPFKELTTLNLSGNTISGSLPNEGFEKLSSLRNLRILDLGYNCFDNNSILQSLGAVTSLETLILTWNLLEGYFPAQELIGLKNLNELDISQNKFNGSLPLQGFERLAVLPKLEILNLGYNSFDYSIIPSLSGLASLKTLSLARNSFDGWNTVAGFESLSRLENLETLDLSFNHLYITILKSLTPVKSLKNLNLATNDIEGSFPTQELANLSNLEVLFLQYNQLNGRLPDMGLSNFSRLEILDLSGNQFNGSISPYIGALSSLKAISLGGNQLSGTLPKGTLPAVPLQWTLLECFDISNNKMSGTIPGWIGSRTTISLVLSNNSFEGQIPCGLYSLTLVDLSYNSLSGSLRSCLNLQSVTHLRLQGNNLTGPIPKVVFNSPSLFTLDLRDNNFFGSIPDEISALSNLRILLLSGNHFSGIIPNQVCWLNQIRIMDLSKNSLSGSISDCFHNMSFGNGDDPAYEEDFRTSSFIQVDSTFQRLLEWKEEREYMDIEYEQKVEVEFVTKNRSNSYSGDILNYMSGLDLSCNKLTGRIPPDLGELSSIHALNLSYNRLTGSISQTFSNLAQLESLDLSHNNLSGEIPSALIDLNFLEVFTVAYNNLSGKVPEWKEQFGTFEKSSYEGNRFLCGKPLENCYTKVDKSQPSPTNSSNASEGKWYEVDPQVFFASFTASYVIFFLGASTLLYIHPYSQQRCFNFIDFKYRCYYPVFDTLKRLSNRLYP